MKRREDEGHERIKDWWDKAQIICSAFAAIFVPVIGAIVGFSISNNIKNQEIRAKMVDLTIQILNKQPIANQDDPLRLWAVRNLNRYADFGFDKALQRDLLTSRSLPNDTPQAMWDIIDVCRNIPVVIVNTYWDYPEDKKAIQSKVTVTRNRRMEDILAQSVRPGIYQDDQSCYYLPETSKEMRDKIVRELNATSEGYISVSDSEEGTYKLQRFCDDIRFFTYLPDYTDVWHDEQSTSTGKICIVNFSPA